MSIRNKLFKSYDLYENGKYNIPHAKRGVSNQENIISWLWKQDDKSEYSWDDLVSSYLMYMDKTDPKTYSRLFNNKFLPKSLVPEIKEFQQHYKDHPVEAMSKADLINLMKNQQNLEDHFIYIHSPTSSPHNSIFNSMETAMEELLDLTFKFSIPPTVAVTTPNTLKKTLIASPDPLEYLHETRFQHLESTFTAPFNLIDHIPQHKDPFDEEGSLFDETELYPFDSMSPEDLVNLLKTSFSLTPSTVSQTTSNNNSLLSNKLNLPDNKGLYNFIRGFSPTSNDIESELFKYIIANSYEGWTPSRPILMGPTPISSISILKTLYYSFFYDSFAVDGQIVNNNFIFPSDVRERMDDLVETDNTFLEDIKHAVQNQLPLPTKYLVENNPWYGVSRLYSPIPHFISYSLGGAYTTAWILDKYDWNNNFVFPWTITLPRLYEHMSYSFSDIPAYAPPHSNYSQIGFNHTHHPEEVDTDSESLLFLQEEWRELLDSPTPSKEDILDLSTDILEAATRLSNYWSNEIWLRDSFEDSMKKLTYYPDCPTFEEMLKVFPNISQIENPEKSKKSKSI